MLSRFVALTLRRVRQVRLLTVNDAKTNKPRHASDGSASTACAGSCQNTGQVRTDAPMVVRVVAPFGFDCDHGLRRIIRQETKPRARIALYPDVVTAAHGGIAELIPAQNCLEIRRNAMLPLRESCEMTNIFLDHRFWCVQPVLCCYTLANWDQR